MIFCVGFSSWKTSFISDFYPKKKKNFIHQTKKNNLMQMIWSNPHFAIWGYTESNSFNEFLKSNGYTFERVEDGFLRSTGLGILKTRPLSLVKDKRGLYYNSQSISDLECVLNNHKFTEEEVNISSKLLLDIVTFDVSKYNMSVKCDIPIKEDSILVIGQVPDDMSIKKSTAIVTSMLDLVKRAKNENPNKTIYFKVHPDMLSGKKGDSYLSELEKIKKYAHVISVNMSVGDILHNVIKVYTISSLMGFEALMRGKEVVCFGAPFYSGWGLTDDRIVVARRKRNLTIEQVFYASYVLYPTYVDPYTRKETDIFNILEILKLKKDN